METRATKPHKVNLEQAQAVRLPLAPAHGLLSQLGDGGFQKRGKRWQVPVAVEVGLGRGLEAWTSADHCRGLSAPQQTGPWGGERPLRIFSQARGPGNPTTQPPISPAETPARGLYSKREKPPEVWVWLPRVCGRKRP